MSYSVKAGTAMLALVIGTFSCGDACAQPPDPHAPAKPSPRDTPAAPPAGKVEAHYVPPDLGAPEVRVSGGTRGGADGLSVFVLAPKQIGLTVQQQPTLYWYSSCTTHAAMRISIVADASSKTVLDASISGPATAGIHGFSLKETKVRLVPDTDYQWSITAATLGDPSSNIVASGMIRRVRDRGPLVPAGLQFATGSAAAFAEAGLWYDALQAVSEQIRARPDDSNLRRQRSSLLSQVGLLDAAAWDRSSVR